MGYEEAAFNSFLDGRNDHFFLDPGNTGNNAGATAIPVGPYQYIPDYAYQGFGHTMTDIAPVPLAFQDWGEYPVNVADPSGTFGGGYGNNQPAHMPNEADLFVDPHNLLYYNLGPTA